MLRTTGYFNILVSILALACSIDGKLDFRANLERGGTKHPAPGLAQVGLYFFPFV